MLGLGEMAEWLKAAVLKTVVGKLTGGSNPSLSARILLVKIQGFNIAIRSGEMAEWLKAPPC